MEPSSIDPDNMKSMIIGALLMGALCGLAPLIAGNLRGYARSGYIGFFVCIVCGELAGALLALPVGLIWMGILLSRPPRPVDAARKSKPLSDSGMPPPL